MRLRRLLSSWYALLMVLAVLGVAAFGGLTVLVRQVGERADTSAISTAKIVTILSVHQNVTDPDFRSANGLSAAAVRDLNADVAALQAAHRLTGLEVWASDGRILYADSGHPLSEQTLSASELARVRRGVPWVKTQRDDRNATVVAVHLPYDAGSDGTVDGLVEVLIPKANIAQAVAKTTRDLYGIAVALLIVSVGGLLIVRRRFMRREYQASHDRLTGLMNWGGFRDTVQATLDLPRNGSASMDALLLIDLDGFKSVNDTLGHPAGDLLLAQVGAELRAAVRPGDVVARMGGDEFAVLLTGLTDQHTVEAAATHVLERLRSGSFHVDGITLGVDASIGIALIPFHGTQIDLLLRRVDVAMYQAKRTGGGIMTYDEASDPHDVGQLTLLGELRGAIDNDELVLHYQPKASIADRHVQSVEALVRWQHPQRGLLAPGMFIPLAERTGLLGPLTQWVLGRAIHDAAHWQRGGLNLAVAVNISPRSLLEEDLPATIVDLLAREGMRSALLEIEITETAIMADPQRAAEVLRELRAIGVRISIDDFGSGYTSLAYLKTLPVDALKIDQSFITNMPQDDQDLAVTQSIIDLGHRLGLTVVAEGVETEQAWKQLVGLGCDEGQGYLLAHPMPAEHIEGWITTHRHSHDRPGRSSVGPFFETHLT